MSQEKLRRFRGKRIFRVSLPVVSVIIPTYNRALVVQEAIASVLAQSHAPFEIIVVDDGSTDDTTAHLAQFSNKITLLQKDNGGAASARNVGIKQAKGDWLAFLDSDDLWLPDRMATFYRDLSGAPETTVAHIADVNFSDMADSLFARDAVVFPKGTATCIPEPFDAHVPGPLLQASVLHSASVRALGGFSEDLPIHEDTLLFRRLALMGQWLVTGDAVAQYRRVDGDEVALMDWEKTRPVPFFASRVRANTRLLEDELLDGDRRTRVARDQSGAYFQLAAAYANQGDTALARRALANSVRSFPRPKTIMRAMLPTVLGKSAYARILDQRTLSLHPDAQSKVHSQMSG